MTPSMKKGASQSVLATTKTATKATAIGAVIIAVILSAAHGCFCSGGSPVRPHAFQFRLPRSRRLLLCTSPARYEVARDQPTSPAAVGALCVAYHADMFFEEADRCYALVTGLEPAQWRWRYYRALIQSERGGGESLIETLRSVVAQASNFGPAFLRLGDAHFKARAVQRRAAGVGAGESGRRARGRAVSASSCR